MTMGTIAAKAFLLGIRTGADTNPGIVLRTNIDKEHAPYDLLLCVRTGADRGTPGYKDR
jgi:hypothetical protein